MSKESEYRDNAATTVLLAHEAATSGDKSRLLQMAERWLDLADRAARLKRRKSAEHKPPAVRHKIDNHPE